MISLKLLIIFFVYISTIKRFEHFAKEYTYLMLLMTIVIIFT